MIMEHYDIDDKNQHFFAKTSFSWGVGDSPMEAAQNALEFHLKPRKGLSKEELKSFYGGAIWHVPVARSKDYQINQ